MPVAVKAIVSVVLLQIPGTPRGERHVGESAGRLFILAWQCLSAHLMAFSYLTGSLEHFAER